MEKKTKLILTGVLIILIIIALVQNRAMVHFSFLFWKMSISQIILIPVLLLIGFALGFLAGRRK